MYRIALEKANDSELWWEHVHSGASETAPTEIRSLLQIGGPPYVLVADREPVLAWARAIPGWDDPQAPTHAPHPLYIEWLEE